jgi:hypothetical protein
MEELGFAAIAGTLAIPVAITLDNLAVLGFGKTEITTGGIAFLAMGLFA